MMTFLQFLLEYGMEDRVHHNISVGHLKAFTKNVGQVRYVIDRNNQLHAGVAHSFIHSEIDPNTVNTGSYTDPTRQKQTGRGGSINGYAEFKNNKFYHHATYLKDEKSENFGGKNKYTNIRHPILSQMQQAGFRRTKHEPEFAW